MVNILVWPIVIPYDNLHRTLLFFSDVELLYYKNPHFTRIDKFLVFLQEIWKVFQASIISSSDLNVGDPLACNMKLKSECIIYAASLKYTSEGVVQMPPWSYIVYC